MATVNDHEITVQEFRYFYELDPNFGLDSTGLNALKDELYIYIYQILAKDHAQKTGLMQDAVFKKAVNWEKRNAMLRELYRQVVSDRINIPESEIRKEYKRSKTEVHIRHIFNKDIRRMREWQDRLTAGESFRAIAKECFQDSVLAANGGDLGWIKLLGLDQSIADSAATLKKYQVSNIIKSKWGYHIIQLLDRRDQVMTSEFEYIQSKKKIKRKLKRQKAQVLANRFIDEYIGNLNPQPDYQGFLLLWRAAVPEFQAEKDQLSAKIILSNDLLNEIYFKLKNNLDHILIKHNKGEITIGRYLQALKKIPASDSPVFKNARQLSNHIGKWIRDELLLELAEQKGIDKSSKVRSHVKRFKEEQSYFWFIQDIANDLNVPDKIQAYFNVSNYERSKYDRKMHKFHTIYEWKLWRAQQIFHKQLKVEENPQIWINKERLRALNDQINWQQRIRMFMIRKPS